ncbi:MAG: hypothetical protein SA339_03240 [Methanomassiliicoccus sp.]|nr:hypothetical protein [Methanomassiliicoccus sp.]
MEDESFRLLGESAVLRVGVKQHRKGTGIEVLARVTPFGTSFRPGEVRDMLGRLEALEDRDYVLTVEDGWWVVCDKAVTEAELPEEEFFILAIFADLLEKR